MPVSAFTHSLYGRISGLYLLLAVVLCLLVGWLTVQQFRQFASEVEQKLHRELAGKLAEALDAELRAGAYAEAAAHADMQTTMFFPALELYILDADGRILATTTPPEALHADRVDLAPVRRLLDPDAILPVWGASPRQPGEPKVFSAAPATLAGGAPGYLYVILRGAAAGSAEEMLQNSYLLRALPLYLLLALGITSLVGLVLFGLLTQRFRRLTATVRHFQSGDYAQRVPVGSADEVGALGRAFNEMADTIQAQVDVLRRTDARRRDLVANVSHDFRTPLTSIRGHAERLRARPDGALTPRQRESLDAIIGNTARLERLADHLHELSRLDARTLEPHLEPFSLAELVQDVLVKFRPEAERHGLTLDACISPGLPPVRADIGLVDRLLANLVRNAIENTPAGGRVELDLRVEAAQVCVRVRDTGRGIPPAVLPLVTQRFYRVDRPALHDGADGSGLGLSIAHEIAALHGGTLHLHSPPGAGTTASFCLPTEGQVAGL
ncbi:MAG: HAMP domain-containing sensor histidine kinase [Rhodothermales bacterium]|nr:HAMP domain-containing sensor histidine kinase [Rhodothermales bacterium]